eukprot:GEMP01001178.1.p1 GENE.GEMP01001178.1~~GEMP01001178.1.p1  ORF type:complete len:938 (+),score=99.91 GEMP01001178.1:255-3068(+)
MAEGGSFWSIVRLSLFLSGVWMAGKSAKLIGISPIIAEISVGVLLGYGPLLPPEYAHCYAEKEFNCRNVYWLQNWVRLNATESDCSHEDADALDLFVNHTRLSNTDVPDCLADHVCKACTKSCEYSQHQECLKFPDMFTILGHSGVSLMIFESGMHFDLKQIRSVGPPALAVALIGTLLPVGVGFGLSRAFGAKPMLAALATGISLAPTSVGISLKLLIENNCLHTQFGQIIVAAAFLDDIFSLVAAQILFSASADDISFKTFSPGLFGIVFLCVGAALAVNAWPKLIHGLIGRIKDKGDVSFQPSDNALMLIIVTLLLGYASIGHLIGSHLLGCFVTGMSFSEVPRAHHIWVRQTKRITSWLMRMFFAGTIAFSIPIEELFRPELIGYGAIMGILACISTKLAAGAFMKDVKWVVGWAMCGRAEFAYLIAGQAKTENILDNDQFVIVIWALLWATMSAPLMFSLALKRYNATQKRLSLKIRDQEAQVCFNSPIKFDKQPSQLVSLQRAAFRVLVVKRMMDEDIDHELHMFFHGQNLIVTSTASKSDGVNYMGVFGVRARTQDINVDFLSHFRANLFNLFNDNDARVVMLPSVSEDGHDPREMLKITVVSKNAPRMLHKVISQIQNTGLTIMQTVCELHHPIFVSGLTYYPHKGEYVIMFIAQVGADVLKETGQTLSAFLLNAASDVKDVVKRCMAVCQEVLVEPLSYDPDPLRDLLHPKITIDLTEVWLDDEPRSRVPTFFRINVNADMHNPALRVVGALQSVLEKTTEVLDANNFVIVICRHDHLPLAPAPSIVIVAQWLNCPGGQPDVVIVKASMVQQQLQAMLAGLQIIGEAQVKMLSGDPENWDGFAVPLHLDQYDTQQFNGDEIATHKSFLDLHIHSYSVLPASPPSLKVKNELNIAGISCDRTTSSPQNIRVDVNSPKADEDAIILTVTN